MASKFWGQHKVLSFRAGVNDPDRESFLLEQALRNPRDRRLILDN